MWGWILLPEGFSSWGPARVSCWTRLPTRNSVWNTVPLPTRNLQ